MCTCKQKYPPPWGFSILQAKMLFMMWWLDSRGKQVHLWIKVSFYCHKVTAAYPGLCPAASWNLGILRLGSFQKDML